MADVKITGAKTSYDEPIGTGGNREDLSDILYDVSPTETPFLTLAKKGSADAVYHEWLTDELEAPAKNAQIEGKKAEPKKAPSRARMGNYTQILEKTASVSGTQEKVIKGGGVKSEMAYQVARRMKEIKRDLELTIVGATPQIKVAGDETTPRKMGSFRSFMTAKTHLVSPTGGVAATGKGANVGTPGTARQFNDSILVDALEKLWTNTGGTESITALMGAQIRGSFSNLKGTSTRYVSTDSANLQASIDVYDGDFHTVTAMPDRWSDPATMFLIDPAYVSIDDLRPIFSQDLATVGDGAQKQILWETTLKVGNPLAHMVIDALKK